jgi:hypothetical protein
MFRWILPALLSGIIALFAFFPLSWAAGFFVPDEAKVFAPDLAFKGTVWNGSLSGIPVFGAANFEASVLSRRVSIQSGEGRNYLSAEVMPNLAEDIDLRVNFEDLPLNDGRLQGLQGALAAQISELKFDGQSCVSAAGVLRTDVLQRNGGSIQWTGPELSGPVTCKDGSLLAALAGRDADQDIEADIKFAPDGLYRADISVRTRREEADAILPLFGFSRSGGSFLLTEQGRWR